MTIRSIVTALVMALLLMPAAPASAQQAKCLAGKTNCMAKKAAGLLNCEALAETPGKPADRNAKECVTKIEAKFDGGLEATKGCFEKLENKGPNDCITFDDTGSAETAVDTCVASLVAAIDPPPLDQTKCGAGKKKCVAKYLAALLKCRKLAQTPGKPADPNTKGCVDKAVAKYTGGGDPTKGCFAKREAKDPNDCQITNDAATVQGLAEDCVEDLVGVVTACAGEPDGTACNDRNACTTVDACQGGRCTGAAPIICDFPGQCQNAGSCDPATGRCSYPPRADGTTCNDGNACTSGDTCEAGSCVSGSPVICPILIFPTQCHQLVQDCNPANGQCVTRPSFDGTSCDDGNACTSSDSCEAGVCGGSACEAGSVCCSQDAPCANIGTDPFNCGRCGHVCVNSICFRGQCIDGCLIGGVAYANGTRNPTNDCLICDAARSRSAWSTLGNNFPNPPSSPCFQGCFNGFCNRGTCAIISATPGGGTCAPASTCVASTCNGSGVCVQTPINEGAACIPSVTTDPCKSGSAGTCQNGSCMHANVADGAYCAASEPPTAECLSTVDGTCQGGACVHSKLPEHTVCNAPEGVHPPHDQCSTGACDANGRCKRVPVTIENTRCYPDATNLCRYNLCNEFGNCGIDSPLQDKTCPDACGSGTTCDPATGSCGGSPPSFGETFCGLLVPVGEIPQGPRPDLCCTGQLCICPPGIDGISQFCGFYGCWDPADITGIGGPVGRRPG